jgi:hypothetical protein
MKIDRDNSYEDVVKAVSKSKIKEAENNEESNNKPTKVYTVNTTKLEFVLFLGVVVWFVISLCIVISQVVSRIFNLWDELVLLNIIKFIAVFGSCAIMLYLIATIGWRIWVRIKDGE